MDDFFEAIQHDRVEALQSLSNRGFDLNTVNARGQGALYLALRQPSPKVVRWLLTQPELQVDARSADDETPLMMAALKGDLDACKALVARGADVNKPGWTPLHYAASGGHAAAIALLLDENAYIDAASPNGSTPLMLAARYGSDDAVQALLAAGADATLKNDLGLTAVDFANLGDRPGAARLIASFGAPKVSSAIAAASAPVPRIEARKPNAAAVLAAPASAPKVPVDRSW